MAASRRRTSHPVASDRLAMRMSGVLPMVPSTPSQMPSVRDSCFCSGLRLPPLLLLCCCSACGALPRHGTEDEVVPTTVCTACGAEGGRPHPEQGSRAARACQKAASGQQPQAATVPGHQCMLGSLEPPNCCRGRPDVSRWSPGTPTPSVRTGWWRSVLVSRVVHAHQAAAGAVRASGDSSSLHPPATPGAQSSSAPEALAAGT